MIVLFFSSYHKDATSFQLFPSLGYGGLNSWAAHSVEFFYVILWKELMWTLLPSWEDEGCFGLAFTQRQSYFQKTEPEECDNSRITPSLSAGWGGHSIDSAVGSQHQGGNTDPGARSLWKIVSP